MPKRNTYYVEIRNKLDLNKVDHFHISQSLDDIILFLNTKGYKISKRMIDYIINDQLPKNTQYFNIRITKQPVPTIHSGTSTVKQTISAPPKIPIKLKINK